MIKKLLLTIAAVLCATGLFAQGEWGGVKGTVVNRAGRAPIAGAELILSQGGEKVASATSDADGKFLIEALPNGMYDMVVKAPGFLDANVNVTIEGYVKENPAYLYTHANLPKIDFIVEYLFQILILEVLELLLAQ